MGSKFFADVDTLSIHGAAGVSYIEMCNVGGVVRKIYTRQEVLSLIPADLKGWLAN
jgi:hypothetical protein